MENNSFEEEVRRASESFRLEPAEKTWSAVEDQIRRKRRPLPLVLLILFSTLLLIPGGYLIWHQSSPVDTEHVLTPDENQDHNEVFIFLQEEDPASPTISDDPNSDENTFEKPTVMIFIPPKTRKFRGLEENPEEAEINSGVSALLKTKEDKSSSPESTDIIFLPPLRTRDIGSIRDRLRNIETNRIPSKTDITSQKQSQKWNFSVAVTGGPAMLFNSFLDLRGPEDPPVQNSPDPNPHPNPEPGDPSDPETKGFPQAPTPTFAFSAHLLLHKSLSARSSIYFAPGYRQIEIHQQTGEKVITAEGEYFLNTPDAPFQYRGNFHFLELPVSIETRLNKNISFPLFWHGGIYISRQLSSDALQFDEERSHFIQDDALFSPWQVGLSTGADMMIFGRQKFPVKIGPYFYYNFSKIAGEGLYGGKHLGSAGLKIEVLLN